MGAVGGGRSRADRHGHSRAGHPARRIADLRAGRPPQLRRAGLDRDKGFTEAIDLAAFAAVPYLALNFVFPRLALGLCGFESGVSVMPLVDGGSADRGHNPLVDGEPKGRVANTRKLLFAAAAIISVMLILSSLVTTLLVEPGDYQAGGKASGR